MTSSSSCPEVRCEVHCNSKIESQVQMLLSELQRKQEEHQKEILRRQLESDRKQDEYLAELSRRDAEREVRDAAYIANQMCIMQDLDTINNRLRIHESVILIGEIASCVESAIRKLIHPSWNEPLWKLFRDLNDNPKQFGDAVYHGYLEFMKDWMPSCAPAIKTPYELCWTLTSCHHARLPYAHGEREELDNMTDEGARHRVNNVVVKQNERAKVLAMVNLLSEHKMDSPYILRDHRPIARTLSPFQVSSPFAAMDWGHLQQQRPPN